MVDLPLGEVHLWMAELDVELGSGLEAACLKLLDAGERERRERFHFPKHQRQFLVSHALVREALSRYAPVAPEAWRFDANAFGRPEIAGPSRAWLRFNLSHADGLALCAVARGVDVGADVENVLREGQTEEIAERFFAPSEVEALFALPPECRRARFFELWTLKEAYIKARGAGLSIPLEQFAFALAEGGSPSIRTDPVLQDDPRAWRFASFRASERHQAAVAVKLGTGPLELAVRKWRVVPRVSAVEV